MLGSVRCKVWNFGLVPKIPHPANRVEGLGFRVRGLRFGVSSFVFRVDG
jgi:hypothetical protein